MIIDGLAYIPINRIVGRGALQTMDRELCPFDTLLSQIIKKWVEGMLRAIVSLVS